LLSEDQPLQHVLLIYLTNAVLCGLDAMNTVTFQTINSQGLLCYQEIYRYDMTTSEH